MLPIAQRQKTLNFPAYQLFQELEIKKCAKEGNREACAVLAKQLIVLRKQKNRTYAANSKITSVGFQNKSMGANIALTEAMGTTAKTMGDMNKLMKPEAIAGDMRKFQQANMKMEMTDEMSMFTRCHFQSVSHFYGFFLRQLTKRWTICWKNPVMKKKVTQ